MYMTFHDSSLSKQETIFLTSSSVDTTLWIDVHHMSEADEEFHVTLDFQSESPNLNCPYSLIGLDTKHPILRIDREVFMGTWAVSIGTEMIFNEKGAWVDNVRKRLVLERVEVQKKSKTKEKSLRQMLIRAEDLEEAHNSQAAAPAQSTIDSEVKTDSAHTKDKATDRTNDNSQANIDIEMQE